MDDWISIVRQALKEDVGRGDVTTECTIPNGQAIKAILIAKEAGVIAGLQVFASAFRLLDAGVQITFAVQDGDAVHAGQSLAEIQGAARSVLTAERVALNFLQRMSGIATQTRRMVEAVRGTGAKILDTRKTVPGLRYLDKWAVRLGGGENHRFGLYDMVLIKDNHIAACGSLKAAVSAVRACDRQGLLIEVEVKNLTELNEALNLKVDRILLDNMEPDTLTQAVKLTAKRIPLEASGNITLQNVRRIAESGVDFISVGCLTHSVQALDLSLRVQE